MIEYYHQFFALIGVLTKFYWSLSIFTRVKGRVKWPDPTHGPEVGQAGSSGKLDALRPSGSGSNTKSAVARPDPALEDYSHSTNLFKPRIPSFHTALVSIAGFSMVECGVELNLNHFESMYVDIDVRKDCGHGQSCHPPSRGV